MSDRRIKLAEFVGAVEVENTHNNWRMWLVAGSPVIEPHLPDPENDANDCDALIKHLNGLGWMMTHTRYRGAIDHIVIQNPEHGRHGWAGDDWKKGVCELALKVIENE